VNQIVWLAITLSPNDDWPSFVVVVVVRGGGVVVSTATWIWRWKNGNIKAQEALLFFAASHLSPPSICHMINVDFVC
jgi:hypothetical protein